MPKQSAVEKLVRSSKMGDTLASPSTVASSQRNRSAVFSAGDRRIRAKLRLLELECNDLRTQNAELRAALGWTTDYVCGVEHNGSRLNFTGKTKFNDILALLAKAKP